MSKTIIGVMGPGENATPDENEIAYDLGKAIAQFPVIATRILPIMLR
jgi:hypothetical protein